MDRQRPMRIVLFLLKCLVGLLASLGLVVVAALLIGALAWRDLAESRRGTLPESMVLTLDLGAKIRDGGSEGGPLAGFGDGPSLRGILDALDAAAADPAVGGVLVHGGAGRLSLARAQELRAALTEFRAADKFAISFAESFAGGGAATNHYLLASGLDEVWLQPSGELDLVGFRIETPFLRALLDEIGITPRIAQREQFKGAAEFLTERRMSAPVRANLQRLLDSWLQQVVEGVAEGRSLPAAEVRNLIDQGPFSAEAALRAGLVDRLAYRDELLAEVRRRAGEDSELVALDDYAAFAKAADSDPSTPAVALIYGLGPVVLKEDRDGFDVGRDALARDKMADAFDAALEDEGVRAIVLRIDSPGGSYVAADAIWRDVVRAGEAGKPVVVSMGQVAASGGYFVAAPAAHILAQPGTVTGSIGVVTGKVVLSELWDDLDVVWDGVGSGANAGYASPNRDFTPAQWARLQTRIDEVYADFTGKVAQGRGLDYAALRAAAGGRVWSGADALERGLVDELGGLRRAVTVARELAGIAADAEIRLIELPAPRDPLTALARLIFGNGDSPGLNAALRRSLRALELLAPWIEMAERLTAGSEAPQLRLPPLSQAD